MGGAVYSNVISVTAAYSIVISDHILDIFGNTGGNITLPDADASTAGREIIMIVRAGSGTWNVAVSGDDNFYNNGGLSPAPITLLNTSGNFITMTFRSMPGGWAVVSWIKKP